MIPVEKNKTYEIKIAALGSNGEGIGRIEGYTVFVEGALPPETCRVLIVKTRKHFGYGKLLEILTPRPTAESPAVLLRSSAADASCSTFPMRRSLRIKQRRCRTTSNALAALRT